MRSAVFKIVGPIEPILVKQGEAPVERDRGAGRDPKRAAYLDDERLRVRILDRGRGAALGLPLTGLDVAEAVGKRCRVAWVAAGEAPADPVATDRGRIERALNDVSFAALECLADGRWGGDIAPRVLSKRVERRVWLAVDTAQAQQPRIAQDRVPVSVEAVGRGRDLTALVVTIVDERPEAGGAVAEQHK